MKMFMELPIVITWTPIVIKLYATHSSKTTGLWYHREFIVGNHGEINFVFHNLRRNFTEMKRNAYKVIPDITGTVHKPWEIDLGIWIWWGLDESRVMVVNDSSLNFERDISQGWPTTTKFSRMTLFAFIVMSETFELQLLSAKF